MWIVIALKNFALDTTLRALQWCQWPYTWSRHVWDVYTFLPHHS